MYSKFEPYFEIFPLILISFTLGYLLTPFLRHIGLKYNFSTKPPGVKKTERGEQTKIHTKTTSRLGEFAMLIPLFLLIWFHLDVGLKALGVLLSLLVVGIFGAIDSKYQLNEFKKLGVLSFCGVLLFVTGTYIDISTLINVGSFDFRFNNPLTGTEVSILSFFLTLIWFYLIPFAVSNVGGVDGLAEGTSAIAILILLLVGIRTNDTITIYIGALSLGGLLGLLPYNFHPAVIFSEHLVYGFLIAILAITSSTKIATSILLLTVPIIDTIYLFYYRTKKYQSERDKSKPFNILKMLSYWGTGDKNHFHHKLLFLGNTPVKISLIMYLMYGILGVIALAVSGLFLTLSILLSVFLVIVIFVYVNKKIDKNTKKQN